MMRLLGARRSTDRTGALCLYIKNERAPRRLGTEFQNKGRP